MRSHLPVKKTSEEGTPPHLTEKGCSGVSWDPKQYKQGLRPSMPSSNHHSLLGLEQSRSHDFKVWGTVSVRKLWLVSNGTLCISHVQAQDAGSQWRLPAWKARENTSTAEDMSIKMRPGLFWRFVLAAKRYFDQWPRSQWIQWGQNWFVFLLCSWVTCDWCIFVNLS